jgi:hypothetical protein
MNRLQGCARVRDIEGYPRFPASRDYWLTGPGVPATGGRTQEIKRSPQTPTFVSGTGRALPLLALCLALAGFAFSQTSSTSLQGSVTDPSGGAIAGATVVLESAESKAARTVVTDAQGEYSFLLLSPGTYTVTVTANGFARYEQKGLQLLVNTPATVTARLKVGGSTETVRVTGEVPALNLVDASLGISFDETQVKQIPLEGRNVPDLLSLQAGAAYTGNRPDINKDQDTRSGAVNGARSDQSNLTLDGVDVNDQANGYAFTSVLPVTLDSVQEFRVTTSNYNADQGEGSGAQVALVTKSGTNSFHGSLYEYNRNTATSANDYFLKLAELNSHQPNKPPKLIRNIFGGSLGGPVQKDRLFFFANYEGTREREDQSVVRNIPTPPLCKGLLTYQNVNGGITTLTPTDLQNLDPLHLGINPAVLSLGRTSQPGYFDKIFCTGQFVTNDKSLGDGYNFSGFRFAAPVSLDNNVFIARIDYHLTNDGKHVLFWRGAMQNLFNPQAPFLPGSPPEQTVVDHSKGFAVGYTAVLSSAMANTFHWGFTRASTGFIGDTDQPWNIIYTLDQGINYSHRFQLPVNNLVDDFSWIKGAHTLQFGTNVGRARDPRVSLLHSFSVGRGVSFWMSPPGFSNTITPTSVGSPLDPDDLISTSCGNHACPEPVSGTAYDYPLVGLFGMVSDIVANYNYDRKGNLIQAGTPVKRDYGLNWYELYGQDSWRIKPNLTLTYGLRWSLFPPPWEVNGIQSTPLCSNRVNPAGLCPSRNLDLGQYLGENAQKMRKGLGYADGPLISFGLGGPANGGPGLYHFEKTDFAPRISLAYSPRPHSRLSKTLFGEGNKTVIRIGFSRVYDRAGMELINTFDQNAPAGLSATLENPCCIPGVDDADDVPRFTGINQIPVDNSITTPITGKAPVVFFTPPYANGFPQTPSPSSQAITWGVDQSLRTPYAWAADFSIGRELPRRVSFQLSYVGRFGHSLLTQRDLTQPLDVVDPKSGIDYFAAVRIISQLSRQSVPANTVTNAMVGRTAAFWQDLIKPLQPYNSGATGYVVPFSVPAQGGHPACTVSQPQPTCVDWFSNPNALIQAIYSLYSLATYPGNETVGLANIDLYGLLSDNAPAPNSYFFNGKVGEMMNNQLTSMYAWSSIGTSNYHALQANLRKQFSQGVQFDFNYTFSKSIDISSAAARLGFSSNHNIGAPGSRLVNAFDPGAARGVSDFDMTHQINANWIIELPFGAGRLVGHNASHALDAVIGGWQLSGLARWTTGLPFTVDNGQFWPTDWWEQGSAQMIARPPTGAFKQPDGTVSMFANPAAALNDFAHPFPGQSGSRNTLRGNGFAGWDMSLSKRWKMPYRETHSLQFRWEVFNVPNLTRFNVLAGLGDGAPSLEQTPRNFGDYTGLLTQPRVMQFALRYEF